MEGSPDRELNRLNLGKPQDPKIVPGAQLEVTWSRSLISSSPGSVHLLDNAPAYTIPSLTIRFLLIDPSGIFGSFSSELH